MDYTDYSDLDFTDLISDSLTIESVKSINPCPSGRRACTSLPALPLRQAGVILTMNFDIATKGHGGAIEVTSDRGEVNVIM